MLWIHMMFLENHEENKLFTVEKHQEKDLKRNNLAQLRMTTNGNTMHTD